MVGTRLTQKAVAEDFYEDCIEQKIPCFIKHGKNQGHFRLYPSYNGVQLQYVLKCGGAKGLTSGFVGAREIYNELRAIHLPTAYKSMLELEKNICKHKAEDDARRRSAQTRT